MKPMHWLIVLIVLLVLFGASKLPDVAHSIGQSAKVLKKDLKDLQEDDTPTAQATAPAQIPVQPQGYASVPSGVGVPQGYAVAPAPVDADRDPTVTT